MGSFRNQQLILFFGLTFGIFLVLADQEYSQISPKSDTVNELNDRSLEYLRTTGPNEIESSIISSSSSLASPYDTTNTDHIRVERSALPILNGPDPTSNFNDGKIQHLDNEHDPLGRYYAHIKPTTTNTSPEGNADNLRTAKLIDENSFLSKRGPKMGPQTNTTHSSWNATNPRQSSNTDIQDIITGIVKLLNGNVNVQAGNGITRKPHTRINNRGPPRISESQPIPADDEQPKPLQPYVFDKNDGPPRPFLNGVPIPEQIVPSMQQNYRPGFISQNKLPWQRPRPRPPIGNRRPIPPYKPIPLPEYKPEDDMSLLDSVTTNANNISITNSSELDDDQFDIVVEDEEDEEEEVKPVDTPDQVEEIKPTSTVTTIIESTSEVNLVSSTAPSIISETISASFEPTNSESLASTQTPSLETVKTTTTVQAENTTTTTIIQTTTPLPEIKATSTHPRPGIVLDDPDFKPGGGQRLPPRQQVITAHPQGYGEIFDITLSAIQGPGGGGMKQTVNVNPYGSYGGQPDIIVSPSGDEGSVFIDGKRTYISLFDQSTQELQTQKTTVAPSIKPTSTQYPGVIGTGYAVAETEKPKSKPPVQRPNPAPQSPIVQHRPIQHQHHHRPKPTQPPVRIDTCIVGDDSTCDLAQNERCKTDSGVSSCHCRPGYSRRKHREPCRKIVSILMSLRVDKIYEKRVVWDRKLEDLYSDAYQKLSYETMRAIDSAMSMTPFSDEFMEANVNRIYNGDASKGTPGVFVNLTLRLEENGETLRPTLKNDIQRHLLGVIHRRNNNIGNSALYVESPPGAVTNLQDVDECTSPDLNDCHAKASCSNIWGSFRCTCQDGFRDPWADQPQRAGRECTTCPDSYCSNRGTCSFDTGGNHVCTCAGSYYGAQCEVDGEVLGVAIGASVIAVIIIVLTLVCLVAWSRKWQREHQHAMGSPVFGYLGDATVKTPVMGQAPYQVTLEDRMRWAQIADVMAQANHYAAEPVSQTRPSSAVFGYPNLHTIGSMGTLGTISLAGTLPIHNTTLPPVPLPRLNLTRPSGMRTLENSSSSEEEDRTDLLGRNFQVPRPKSRSNASITNQSGIYYDVEYEPSGDLYNTNPNMNQMHHAPQGIPLSTYNTGRPPSSYYK